MTRMKHISSACCLGAAALFACPFLVGQAAGPMRQQPMTLQFGNPPALTPVESAAQAGDRETLRNLVKNGSPADQEAAFSALFSLDAEVAVEAATSDFRNRSLGTRLQSLQMIDRSILVDRQTAVALLHEALHDPDTQVSDFAIDALARRSETEGRLLTTSEVTGPETQSRQLAKVRLAALDHDQSSLVGMMRSGDGLVQASAFEALKAIDAPSAFSEAVSELNSKDTTRQLQLLELLLRSPETDRQLLGRVLAQASKSPDTAVKTFASQALTRKNLEEAQPHTTQSELK